MENTGIYEQDRGGNKLGYAKVGLFLFGFLILLIGGVALASPVSDFFDKLSLENKVEKISEEIGINKGTYAMLEIRKKTIHTELKILKAKILELDTEWHSIDNEFNSLEKKNDVLRLEREQIKGKLGK